MALSVLDQKVDCFLKTCLGLIEGSDRVTVQSEHDYEELVAAYVVQVLEDCLTPSLGQKLVYSVKASSLAGNGGSDSPEAAPTLGGTQQRLVRSVEWWASSHTAGPGPAARADAVLAAAAALTLSVRRTRPAPPPCTLPAALAAVALRLRRARRRAALLRVACGCARLL